jgi:enolase-phosphatase E1
VSLSLRQAGVRALVLDIEGTTTPVSFVYETLFPYARAHLRSYLEFHAAVPSAASLIQRFRDEHAADAHVDGSLPAWRDDSTAARIASLAAYAGWLMDRDRKSTALKELQGLIWEDGYRSGALKGAVFADVASALARWRAAAIPVAIFSSGSVLAQKLLFEFSTAGDLTPFVTRHFDTTTGPKVEPESYRRIASAMQVPPSGVLFISDVPRELDAANAAGMQVVLAIRPGNASVPADRHQVIQSFDEVVE